MNVYPIILLSLNQALVCSASLSAYPVGSDDLSDRTRHRRAYRRPWWSCAALHSQSALNFLAGHQINLKKKSLLWQKRKRVKVGERRKRWHSCYWRFATHSSIQELQPSTVMWQSLQRLRPTSAFCTGNHTYLQRCRSSWLSKFVIVLYGQLTLSVDPELLKPGPHIWHYCHQWCQFHVRISRIIQFPYDGSV